MAWFWFLLALSMFGWNAFLMWCNSELLHELRRVKAEALARVVGGVVVPSQREAGDR